jgi:tricarballylate dehydrogenase
MALEHGAQTTRGFGFFYGHVEAWPPLVPEDPAEFEAFDKGLARDLLATIQNFSARGLFINYEGKRFCDENSAPELAGRFCEAILQQTRGHVFLVLDANDIATNADGVALLKNNGLVFDEASTIEALADKLVARGVHKGNFLKTIQNYKSTPIADLEIPKTGRTPTALQTAPFIAMQISASPSASFGGVKINTKGQVINHGEKPIGGLFATACCAGGFFYNEYGGSLGASAVFGKICAETALSTIS